MAMTPCCRYAGRYCAPDLRIAGVVIEWICTEGASVRDQRPRGRAVSTWITRPGSSESSWHHHEARDEPYRTGGTAPRNGRARRSLRPQSSIYGRRYPRDSSSLAWDCFRVGWRIQEGKSRQRRISLCGCQSDSTPHGGTREEHPEKIHPVPEWKHRGDCSRARRRSHGVGVDSSLPRRERESRTNASNPHELTSRPSGLGFRGSQRLETARVLCCCSSRHEG